MAIQVDTYSCPECGAPMSADSSVGLCLNCAGRDLQNVLFNHTGEKQSSMDQPTIPGWCIKRLLGSGGMGQLWLAKATDDGRPGVIKIPIPGAADPDELAERFETEAELLSGLEHPNILSVEDIGTAEDGRLFFVTEFVEGCDLRRLMRGGKLPQERAIDIFSKVCEAIEFAHSEGVVHRDLKPSNILVASDGTVKVADFGLAKDVSMPSSDGRTSAGDGLGTPYYLAPESMRDAASADERSDVFSLGVLLYELLTGSVPAGSFTKLSERCNFGRSWDSVLQGALNDLPANRTATVSELRLSVEKLWSREQQREQWKRRRLWLVLGSLLLVAAALGALLAPSNEPEKISYPDPETASRETPWANSLGMTFVPVGDLLVSVHETRLADFSAFHEFEGGSVPEWRLDSPGAASVPGTVVMTNEGWALDPEASPSAPGFDITAQHPVCGITSTDAWTFCTWLTLKERTEGRIREDQRYRLPTIFEWLLAARGEGRQTGNYARAEVDDGNWPPLRRIGSGRDDYPRSGPVDAFAANPQGIKGAGGNVAEWALPKRSVDAPGDNDARFIGYSWADLPPDGSSRPTARSAKKDGFRRTDIGFRVVLELGK